MDLEIGQTFYSVELSLPIDLHNITEEVFDDSYLPYKDWDVSDKATTFLTREDAETFVEDMDLAITDVMYRHSKLKGEA
jgi:hypothetical protein